MWHITLNIQKNRSMKPAKSNVFIIFITHTHTHTNKHTKPPPKPTHHTKLSAFLHFQ